MADIKKIAAKGKKIKLSKPTGKESVLKPVISHYSKSAGITNSKAVKELKEKQFFIIINQYGTDTEPLIESSGISFICEYPPTESKALSSGEHNTIEWFITSSSVWIVVPKPYFEPTNQQKLLSFYQELSQFKGHDTISGVLFVVATDHVINNSREDLQKTSSNLQKQLTLLNRSAGVTPPVYLIFDNTDTIEGFDSFFGDDSGRWDEQLLGTSLDKAEQHKPIKEILPEKVEGIIEQVRLIELKMTVREKDETTRREITKFTSHFMNLRDDISDFVVHLLSPINTVDKNHLGGLFFTAVYESGPQKSKTFFMKPVLQTVIPSVKKGISQTTERKKTQKTRTVVHTVISALFLAIFFALILTSTNRVNQWERKHAQALTQPVTYTSAGMLNLHNMYNSYTATLKHSKGEKTALMVITGYNPKEISNAVQQNYFKELHTAITIPATKALYNDLYRAVIDGSSDLSNQFMPLKNTLRTYLACSAMGVVFPTLYDEEILQAKLVPIVTRQFYNNTTPTEEEVKAINEVVTSYITLLKSGELKSPYKPKEKVVTATQDRLVSLFDVKVVYETTIETLKKKGTNLFLFDLIAEANEVNMNSNISLHEVYTPKAWKDYIGKEISKASTRLNNVEKWVVGKNDNRMNDSFTNPEKLYRGMVSFYLDDTRSKWRDFVKSINLYRYNSMYEASHVMLKLGSSSSAIAKTFEKFNQMNTEFKDLGGSEKEGDLFLAFADSLEIFSEVINNLAPYQKYIKQCGSGIADHRKKGTLCTVFNGTASDPLYNLYNYINRTMLPQLSKNDQEIVTNLLYQPYERTKRSLIKPISTELDSVWKNEIADPFNKLFAGRYPFASSSKEADYATVMEYFTPKQGSIWKSFSNSLAGFVTKSNGRYSRRRRNGMVPVTVSDDVLAFFDRADLITKIFFSENGKPKTWKFSITPTSKTKLKSANITIGDISGNVMETGALKYEWPESKGSLIMKFTDINNNPGMEQKHGEWIVMKEFNNASLAAPSQKFLNRFPAQFTVRAYARQFSLRAEIVVSSPYHPFSHNPFLGMVAKGSFTK